MLKDFINFIENEETEVKAETFRIKGNDNGKGGDFFEVSTKIYLKNTRGKLISKQGQIDTRKKGIKYAIKTGYGQLFHIDEDGRPTSGEFVKADYVIWSGDPLEKPEDALVVSIEDLLASDIIRLVYGTNQYKKPAERSYKGEKIEGAYKNQVNFISNKKKVDEIMFELSIGTLEQVINDYVE